MALERSSRPAPTYIAPQYYGAQPVYVQPNYQPDDYRYDQPPYVQPSYIQPGYYGGYEAQQSSDAAIGAVFVRCAHRTSAVRSLNI